MSLACDWYPGVCHSRPIYNEHDTRAYSPEHATTLVSPSANSPGIADDSVPLPLLYDIGTSNRVTLHPGIPSGRTLLAASDGCPSSRRQNSSGGEGVAKIVEESSMDRGVHRIPFPREQGLFHRCRRCRCRRHERAGVIERYGQSTSPRPPLNRETHSNALPLRRIASAGNLRCTSAAEPRHATNAEIQAKGGVAYSGPRIASASSSVTMGGKGDFAQEVEQRQLQLRREREEELRETQRRREARQRRAKAVACQLACRVAHRGHRTRLLVVALWRWKAHASELKLEQDRREEQRRNDEQVRVWFVHENWLLATIDQSYSFTSVKAFTFVMLPLSSCWLCSSMQTYDELYVGFNF